MIPFIAFMILQSLPAGTGTSAASQQCGLLPGPVAAQISANESWYCPINNQVYQQWTTYLPIMLLVTLLAFMIAAIIFMVGNALQSPKIRSFGISELYEALATTIIVIAFVYVCAVLFGLVPGAFVGAINPYATSFNLISTTIATAQSMYSTIYRTYLFWAPLASLNVELSGAGTGIIKTIISSVGGTLGGGLTKLFSSGIQTIPLAFSGLIQVLILEPAQAIAGFLADGIYVLYGEYYLLEFFAVAAIPIFLIPGVIFRAIMPTRALGGVLIAMAIGFYLIMPTLFATVYYFTAPSLIKGMNVASGQLLAFGTASAGGAVTASSPVVQDLQNAQSALNGFWMLILFYPSIIISITYAFIEQLAGLIGGNYRSSGRLRSFL